MRGQLNGISLAAVEQKNLQWTAAKYISRYMLFMETTSSMFFFYF